MASEAFSIAADDSKGVLEVQACVFYLCLPSGNSILAERRRRGEPLNIEGHDHKFARSFVFPAL
jgi:hypothetical protein